MSPRESWRGLAADCVKTLSLSSFSFLLRVFFSLSLFFFVTARHCREKKKKLNEKSSFQFPMWRELPPDLANLVFEELKASEDRAAFRMVCRYFACGGERENEEANVHRRV